MMDRKIWMNKYTGHELTGLDQVSIGGKHARVLHGPHTTAENIFNINVENATGNSKWFKNDVNNSKHVLLQQFINE